MRKTAPTICSSSNKMAAFILSLPNCVAMIATFVSRVNERDAPSAGRPLTGSPTGCRSADGHQAPAPAGVRGTGHVAAAVPAPVGHRRPRTGRCLRTLHHRHRALVADAWRSALTRRSPTPRTIDGGASIPVAATRRTCKWAVVSVSVISSSLMMGSSRPISDVCHHESVCTEVAKTHPQTVMTQDQVLAS